MPDPLLRISEKLKSDCHCVDHLDRNLVYAGLRNADILLEDLRIRPRVQNVLTRTLKGKAVVGVKKMKEALVPWGLAVSGMSNEVSLPIHHYDLSMSPTIATDIAPHYSGCFLIWSFFGRY